MSYCVIVDDEENIINFISGRNTNNTYQSQSYGSASNSLYKLYKKYQDVDIYVYTYPRLYTSCTILNDEFRNIALLNGEYESEGMILHFKDGKLNDKDDEIPAVSFFNDVGYEIKKYYTNGLLHRNNNKPSMIKTFYPEHKVENYWYEHGIRIDPINKKQKNEDDENDPFNRDSGRIEDQSYAVICYLK